MTHARCDASRNAGRNRCERSSHSVTTPHFSLRHVHGIFVRHHTQTRRQTRRNARRDATPDVTQDATQSATCVNAVHTLLSNHLRFPTPCLWACSMTHPDATQHATPDVTQDATCVNPCSLLSRLIQSTDVCPASLDAIDTHVRLIRLVDKWQTPPCPQPGDENSRAHHKLASHLHEYESNARLCCSLTAHIYRTRPRPDDWSSADVCTVSMGAFDLRVTLINVTEKSHLSLSLTQLTS